MDHLDYKAGKGADLQSTSTKPQLVYCLCQSTTIWRYRNCRFRNPTHNFKPTPEVYMSAIYLQSHVILIDYRFYLQIYNGQIKRMRNL